MKSLNTKHHEVILRKWGQLQNWAEVSKQRNKVCCCSSPAVAAIWAALYTFLWFFIVTRFTLHSFFTSEFLRIHLAQLAIWSRWGTTEHGWVALVPEQLPLGWRTLASSSELKWCLWLFHLFLNAGCTVKFQGRFFGRIKGNEFHPDLNVAIRHLILSAFFSFGFVFCSAKLRSI